MTQVCLCQLGDTQQNSCWGLLSRHMNAWEHSDALTNCVYMVNWYILENFLPVATGFYEVCSYLCKAGVSHCCVMLSCLSPSRQKYTDFREVYKFPLGMDPTAPKVRAALFIACAFQILSVQEAFTTSWLRSPTKIYKLYKRQDKSLRELCLLSVHLFVFFQERRPSHEGLFFYTFSEAFGSFTAVHVVRT